MASHNYFRREASYPPSERNVVVEVDAALIPVVIDAIEGRKPRSFWDTEASWVEGRNRLGRFQEALLMGGDINEALNRIYMAVRQLSVGEVFPTSGNQLVTELPLVPPALPSHLHGLLNDLYALRGGTPPGWFGITESQPISLIDVLKALRQGEPNEVEGILDKIDLLGDASDVTGIYGAVRGTVADVGLLAEGGGTMVVLLAAMMGQVMAAQLASIQMQTTIGKLTQILEKQQATLDLLAPPEVP